MKSIKHAVLACLLVGTMNIYTTPINEIKSIEELQSAINKTSTLIALVGNASPEFNKYVNSRHELIEQGLLNTKDYVIIKVNAVPAVLDPFTLKMNNGIEKSFTLQNPENGNFYTKSFINEADYIHIATSLTHLKELIAKNNCMLGLIGKNSEQVFEGMKKEYTDFVKSGENDGVHYVIVDVTTIPEVLNEYKLKEEDLPTGFSFETAFALSTDSKK